MALAQTLIFGFSAARTPGQVTKVLAVTILPFSLIGPFTGPFIDRFSRRSILVGTNLARAALTAALLIVVDGPETLVLGMTVLIMSANRFFHATKDAVLPLTIDDDQYLLGNTVSNISGRVFGIAAAAVGAPLADLISPRLPIALGAGSMLLAAVIASRLTLPAGERHGLRGILTELRQDARDVRAGLRILHGSPRARFALASIVLKRSLLGFVLLASLVLLRERFDVGATGYSVILASVGAGNFLGAVLVPRTGRWLGHTGMMAPAFLLAGTAVLLGLPVPSYALLLAAVFVVGIAETGVKIAADTMVQRAIPDEFRGRVFSVYDIGYNGAFVLSALVPTLLRPVIGDLGIVLLTGGLYFACAAWLARWRRHVPPTLDVEAYAGGRADEAPRRLALDGVPFEVEEVERSWNEEHEGERLRRFRVRLKGGRRVDIATDGDTWRLV